MKLSEYIEHLEAQVLVHGDVEVVEYNHDDYGECFYNVLDKNILGEVIYFKKIETGYPEPVTVYGDIDVSGLTKAYII